MVTKSKWSWNRKSTGEGQPWVPNPDGGTPAGRWGCLPLPVGGTSVASFSEEEGRADEEREAAGASSRTRPFPRRARGGPARAAVLLERRRAFRKGVASRRLGRSRARARHPPSPNPDPNAWGGRVRGRCWSSRGASARESSSPPGIRAAERPVDAVPEDSESDPSTPTYGGLSSRARGAAGGVVRERSKSFSRSKSPNASSRACVLRGGLGVGVRRVEKTVRSGPKPAAVFLAFVPVSVVPVSA